MGLQFSYRITLFFFFLQVSQQINYAKGMHEERSLTLTSSDNMLDDMRSYK